MSPATLPRDAQRALDSARAMLEDAARICRLASVATGENQNIIAVAHLKRCTEKITQGVFVIANTIRTLSER